MGPHPGWVAIWIVDASLFGCLAIICALQLWTSKGRWDDLSRATKFSRSLHINDALMTACSLPSALLGPTGLHWRAFGPPPSPGGQYSLGSPSLLASKALSQFMEACYASR